MMRAILAVMNINEIREPSDSCPCFLWVPCPVMTPCFLCPERSHEHSKRHEGEPNIGEIIRNLHLFRGICAFLEEEQIHRHDHSCTQEGISHHVNDDVRGKTMDSAKQA